MKRRASPERIKRLRNYMLREGQLDAIRRSAKFIAQHADAIDLIYRPREDAELTAIVADLQDVQRRLGVIRDGDEEDDE